MMQWFIVPTSKTCPEATSRSVKIKGYRLQHKRVQGNAALADLSNDLPCAARQAWSTA